MSHLRYFLCLSAAFFLVAPVCHADWLRFRGPNGTGISAESTQTPTAWAPDKNVQWKLELPGSGVSSPIVVGDRVIVTCYSGYGLSRENPGDINDLKRHVVCVDLSSGKMVWQKTIDAVQPEDPYEGIGVTAHGYASHTPASDGKNVYVFLGKSGVFAYDLDGNQLWTASVGTGSDRRQWGSSSSPILYEGSVIVTASAESRALVGLNKETGAELWRQETDGLSDVWGTPSLVTVDKDRTDLILGVPYEFWGMNPSNGKLRWYAEVLDTDQYSSSVVESDGVIYGIEGRGGGSAAVKIGGNKDVTDTHTVWTGRDSSRFGSPLILDGRIYYFNGGIASCIDASDGSSVFNHRLPGASSGGDRGGRGGPGGAGGRGPAGGDRGRGGAGAGGRGPGGGGGRGTGGPGGRGGRGGRGGGGFGPQDYASAVSADGKIYYVQSDGTTFVLNASEKFELLATNKLTEDRERFGGTPAISDGKLVFRSDKHLYCVGD